MQKSGMVQTKSLDFYIIMYIAPNHQNTPTAPGPRTRPNHTSGFQLPHTTTAHVRIARPAPRLIMISSNQHPSFTLELTGHTLYVHIA